MAEIEVQDNEFALTEDERTKKEQELLAVFEDCRDYRRPFEDEAQDDYNNYLLLMETVESGRQADGRTSKEENAQRSNLKMPAAFRILDTLICRMYTSLVNARPWIPFKPKPTDDVRPDMIPLLEAKAKKASAVLDMDLEKNEYECFAYQHCFNLAIWPAAWIGIGWRTEEREIVRRVPAYTMEPVIDPATMQPVIDPTTGMPATQKVEHPELGYMDEKATVTVWDNNEFKCLDFNDVWPDPRGDWRIDSWRFGFIRDWWTKKRIEDYLDWYAQYQKGQVFNLDWEKIGKPQLYTDDSKWTREANSDTSAAEETESDVPNHLQLYEVLFYWEPDKLALIIERKSLAIYGPNLYRHGMIPLAGGSFFPISGRPIGVSAASRIRTLQDERDTETNQRIDNNSRAINGGFWKDPDADEISDADLVSQPNMLVKGVLDKDFGRIPYEPVNPAAYQDPAILLKEMEDSLGVTSVDSGGQEDGDPTATEITIRTRSAGVRYDTRIKLISATGLKRLAMLGDLNNQQFMEKSRLVKVFDDEGVMSWAQADLEEVLGEHDYAPTANNDPSVNKELKRAQTLQAVEVMSKIPTLAQIQKWDAIGREIWRLFDVADPARFQMTEQEIMQQQMMAQIQGLIQQLMAGQQQQAQMEQEAARADEQMAFEREKEENRKAEAGRQTDQADTGQLIQALMPLLTQFMTMMTGGAQSGQAGA